MRSRLFGALGVVAIVAAACSSTGATPSPSASSPAVSAPASAPAASGSQAAGGKQWKIGYSNGGGVGNGFREEQVCTAKAEALASGQVSQLTTIHRNTDAAGQLQDIRDLIAAGVDAIVFNPNDPAALNPALDEAKAAGIKTVAVDAVRDRPGHVQPVQQPGEVRRARRQVAVRPAEGARAPSGTARLRRRRADTDRDTGLQERPQGLPEHHRPPEQAGCRDPVGSGDHHAGHERLHRERRLRQGHRHLDVRHGRRDRSTPSRRRTRSSSRSSAPTAVASSPSSSTRRTIRASTARP